MKNNVIFDLIDVLFTYDPINHFVPIAAGHALLQDQIKHNKKIYLLSNCSNYKLELLKKQYPEFIDTLDGFVISDECGFRKPQPEMFLYLLQKYNLEAFNCIFFDDNIDNIETAKKLGIEAHLII